MIHAIYAEKDATIYEISESLNTGLDSTLELAHHSIQNVASGSYTKYNSRILIKFNLGPIQTKISQGKIPTGSAAKYYLSLRCHDASEIPTEYTVYGHPLSGSWSNGTGRFYQSPQPTNGASWKYRTSRAAGVEWDIPVIVDSYTWDEIYLTWVDSDFYFGSGVPSLYVTSSYTTTEGGGNWYFGNEYDVSQSFSWSTSDIYMDVSRIVNRWLTGSQAIGNDGIILKYSSTDEKSNEDFGSMKFYGADSNTIYVPRLLVYWDDSRFVTGSLSPLTDDSIMITAKLKSKYKESEQAKIRLHARAMYPRKSWVTSSAYMEVKYLPTSSYWELRDALTNDVIYPFDDTGSKISCDANGNYFNCWMDGLQPERFYKFWYKVVKDGGDTINIYDDGQTFKVIR